VIGSTPESEGEATVSHGGSSGAERLDGAAILGRMRDLRETMESRADEIEKLGTIPDDLHDRIVETGYLRMTVPARFGGAECSLAEASAIIFEAARADGSVGWLAMIAAHMPIVLSRLAPEAFAALFAEGPDLRARLVGPPKGAAVPVEAAFWCRAVGVRQRRPQPGIRGGRLYSARKRRPAHRR